MESSTCVFVYLKPISSQWQIPVKMSINLHGNGSKPLLPSCSNLDRSRSGYWKMLINTLENSLNRGLVSGHPVGMCVNANMSNATIYNHDCWLCCFPAWKWMTWQMDPSMCSQRAASLSIQYPETKKQPQHPSIPGIPGEPRGSRSLLSDSSVAVRLKRETLI